MFRKYSRSEHITPVNLRSRLLSEHLLRVTAEDLQAQGDVVDPTPRVDTEVAAEQRRIKNGDSFLIWIVVPSENLRWERAGMTQREKKWEV